MKWNPVSRAAIAVAFAGVCAAASAAPNGLGVDALDDFARQNPAARFYESNGLITSIYGPAFAQGVTAQASVDSFLAEHADVFGVRAQDLVPRLLGSASSHAIPLMPDIHTGQPKFTVFAYTQTHGGLEVFGGEMRLLVRNEEGSPLVLARSAVRPVGNFVVDRAAAADLNVDMAHTFALLRDPTLRVFSEPTAVIFAGTEFANAEPRLAFTFIAESPDVLSPTYSAWKYVADAATGEILHEEPMVFHAEVTGTVSGNATQGPGADFCHPETPVGMPYARVSVGGNVVFADVNGDFVLPNVDGPVSITASIGNGQFFRVSSNPTVTVNATAPGEADFLFNGTPSEVPNAEVNTYLQANLIRDWVLARSPSYPLEVNGGMQINPNINDQCNATYSPQAQSIQFYRSGGGCPNTGFASVVHHEYGHHLVQTAGSGQGQYGEGMGDCMSVLMNDDPILGRGWSGGNCSGGLRTAVNSTQYPCSGAIHSCGTLISGAVWDTRNALFATNPSDYLEILSTLVVNSILLHTGSSITPQVTIDLLTLDDDNSDILDGTPHYYQIDEGFSAHNMDAPALNLLSFNYPDGIPETLNPSGATAFSVLVGGVGGDPDAKSIQVLADLDGNGSFEALSGSVESSGSEGVLYVASFPAGECGDSVPFYVVAETTLGNPVSSPSEAPEVVFNAVVATSFDIAFEDDFESDMGWTIGAPTDNASTGVWTRVNPNGTAAQPENDFDDDGTICFVTGQGSPGGGLGDNDVDGGTTTLISPAFDASTPGSVLTYARWYSNDTGGAPNADTFLIDISNNNGSTWTPLEVVGPAGDEASGGWYVKSFVVSDFVTPSDQVRVRFRASDLGTGSLVEAAVDAVRVEAAVCLVSCPGDITGDLLVNFDDLNLLLDNFGMSGTGLAGDFDLDGDVDFEDLNNLLDAFGQSCE